MEIELAINIHNYWKHSIIMLPILICSFHNSFKEIDNAENEFIENEFIILKNISINDTLKGDFIFDTGSNHTIINSENVNKHNPKSSIITDFYGNSDSISMLKNVKLEIYNHSIKNVTSRIYNISSLAKKYNIIGILGTDIISKYCWEFNFNNNKITVNNIPFKTDSLSFINVNFKKKSALIDAIYIDGVYMRNFMLDSGSLSEITSNDTLLSTNNSEHYKEENLVQSITKKKLEKLNILLSYNSIIKIGNYDFKNIKLQTNPKYRNLIGLDFFPKNTLVFDGISSKLYFKNVTKLKSQGPSKKGFRFGLDKNNNIIIVAVIEKSESYLKGMKLGDEIITVNKLNINYYKTRIDELNQLRDNIKEIVISRNKEIIKYNF
jgi:Aspartyl protease